MRKLFSMVFLAVLLLIVSGQGTWAQQNKVWELGTYPNGTWAVTGDINNFGLVAGQGDLPDGSTHSLAVSLFGPRAGKWFDLGTLGGKASGWEEGVISVSDTGMIVGHDASRDNDRAHAFVWTEKSGMVDLGTLADIGYPTYNSSYAYGVNKQGTLIVGWSGVEESCIMCAPSLPVVWTPSVVWKNGQAVTRWTMQKLDTGGFDEMINWFAWGVNDSGQIVGEGFNQDMQMQVGVLWTPLKNGKWKLTRLPFVSDHPVSEPFKINDRGEISGDLELADFSAWIPAYWKPLDPLRKTYSAPIVLAMPEGVTTCYAEGINELGDLTGECWNDDYSFDRPMHWITKNPTFFEVLTSPGDWGWSFSVNNNRIAAVTYGGGNKCSGNTYISCGGAVQFNSK